MAAAAIFSSDVDSYSISAASITHFICLQKQALFVYFPLCHRKKLKADGNRILLTSISYLSVSKSAKAKKKCLFTVTQPILIFLVENGDPDFLVPSSRSWSRTL